MLQAKAMTMHVFLPLFSCHVSKITPKLLNDTVGVPKKPQNTWPQGLLFSWNTLRTSSRISSSVHHYSFWLLNFCAILNVTKCYKDHGPKCFASQVLSVWESKGPFFYCHEECHFTWHCNFSVILLCEMTVL